MDKSMLTLLIMGTILDDVTECSETCLQLLQRIGSVGSPLGHRGYYQSTRQLLDADSSSDCRGLYELLPNLRFCSPESKSGMGKGYKGIRAIDSLLRLVQAFICYIVLNSFMMLNMLVGILVEVSFVGLWNAMSICNYERRLQEREAQ